MGWCWAVGNILNLTQVPDLNEKAYLHEVIQVPELNETYLCEGKQMIKDDDGHLRILSNMMEEETHVDNISFGEEEDICQVLFDIVEDQSEVHRRAVKETSISGHPQSNQLRLGKPDGEPGTHITTNISDRQSQMVEGNLLCLSLNCPKCQAGNPLHDIYCCSKCKPMDESGIWSILTDTLQYVKAEVDSPVTYSFDQRRYQSSKSKYFEETNTSTDENASVNKTYNSKGENFDAANYNRPNMPIYSQQGPRWSGGLLFMGMLITISGICLPVGLLQCGDSVHLGHLFKLWCIVAARVWN